MLVCPDTVTIETLGTATTHASYRIPMGRRKGTTLSLRAQVEIRGSRKTDEQSSLELQVSGDLLFATRDLADADYSPARGDRLTTVVWSTGETQSFNLYLGVPMREGAGNIVRCRLSDRSPAKSDPQ